MIKIIFQFIILLQSSATFILAVYTAWVIGYFKVKLRKGLESLGRWSLFLIFVTYLCLSLQVGLDLYYKFNPCISDLKGHALAFPIAMVGFYSLMLFTVNVCTIVFRSCHRLMESIDNAPQDMAWFFKIFITHPYTVFGVFAFLDLGIVAVITLLFWENPVAAWFWLKNTAVMGNVLLQASSLIMRKMLLGLIPVVRRNAELLATSPKLAQAGFEREVQLTKQAGVHVVLISSCLLLELYVIIAGSLQWQSRLNYNYSEKSCYDGYDIDFIDFNSSIGGIFFLLVCLRAYKVTQKNATEVKVENPQVNGVSIQIGQTNTFQENK